MIKSDNLLKLKSNLDSIPIVEQLIDEISTVNEFSSEIYGKLTLAVIEAVNNAIIHGNELDEDKSVFIEYQINNNELVFNIKDEGVGFDYSEIPDPTSPLNLEKTNGRGLYLMNHLADKIAFNKNGSEVELKFIF
ncbi:MAG: ATP-binding protein [Marinifilaceae bacterium]|jgi:serine/threonine-protein kinase RsbW|nr:ATP-binding protein [Marinifilaceae bacterium]